jgi:hypothetical protein
VKSRKLTGYAITAFLLFLTITNPQQSADVVRTVASGINTFATALTAGGDQ